MRNPVPHKGFDLRTRQADIVQHPIIKRLQITNMIGNAPFAGTVFLEGRKLSCEFRYEYHVGLTPQAAASTVTAAPLCIVRAKTP